MTTQPPLDTEAAHKYFSVNCFNQAWDLIEKPDRSPDEDEQMIRLSQASLWHWTQRLDCTDKNISIGYWQTSRIYALLKQPENARRYGRLALQHSPSSEPFYAAYAYEALARAESIAENHQKAGEYIAEARRLAETVGDEQDRKSILDDLDTVVRATPG